MKAKQCRPAAEPCPRPLSCPFSRFRAKRDFALSSPSRLRAPAAPGPDWSRRGASDGEFYHQPLFRAGGGAGRGAAALRAGYGGDRKSVVLGKSVDLGGGRIIKKKKKIKKEKREEEEKKEKESEMKRERLKGE